MGSPVPYLTSEIEAPPFYAAAGSLQVHDTMGGLPISAKAQVRDIYGKVIPGLYAAGEVAHWISSGWQKV